MKSEPKVNIGDTRELEEDYSLLDLVKADLFRAHGKDFSWTHLLKSVLWSNNFKFIFWFRVAQHYRRSWNKFFYLISKYFYRKYKIQYGLWIPLNVKIGPGVEFPHSSSIVMDRGVVIGKNCKISHNTSIGRHFRKKGSPKIGDNVIIGPNSIIYGRIVVGNNAVIGSLTLVNKDVPDNGVVVGVPGKLISHSVSKSLIENP